MESKTVEQLLMDAVNEGIEDMGNRLASTGCLIPGAKVRATIVVDMGNGATLEVNSEIETIAQ